MKAYRYCAPCLFGVEGILAEELRRMDAQDVVAENGRVLFSGGPELLIRANLRCRCAERILILLGQFPARTFTELFDSVKALPFSEWIGKADAFPVKGWSLNSTLHSVPDCQAIIKKAAVEAMKTRYRVDWFQETGPLHQIQFSIHKDMVSIMLDTSGEGLHKRGYRRYSMEAPLKETLAAAMAYLARLYPDTVLLDPFCGSGTILIEAALLACNIAPGIGRSFAAEKFGCLDAGFWRNERAAALDLATPDIPFQAIGSDVDPQAVELTLANAAKAGVESKIAATAADVSALQLPEGRVTLITNPPYGERLGDEQEAQTLIRTLGQVCPKERGKRYYIISPEENFESLFGRPADKRRKLYNGMIKCQMFSFFKS